MKIKLCILFSIILAGISHNIQAELPSCEKLCKKVESMPGMDGITAGLICRQENWKHGKCR